MPVKLFIQLQTSGIDFWSTVSTATTMACAKSSPPVPIAVNSLTVGYELTYVDEIKFKN